MRKETPRQYAARRLRISIERAKVAVIDAQALTFDLKCKPGGFIEMLDAAFTRLDSAWSAARRIELADMEDHGRNTNGAAESAGAEVLAVP